MRPTRPTTHRRVLALLGAGALATGLTAALTTAPASARHGSRAVQATSETLHRGGAAHTVTFHRAHAGEAFLSTTVSAPGVSWADRGNESAVVSAYVDGHYATDIVITSATGVRRQFALGHLDAGRHKLRLVYASGRSRSDAGVARLRDISFSTVRRHNAAYAAAAYAPVLYGRDGRTLSPSGGKYDNARTDTPLVAWHEILPAKKHGHAIIQYSVVWSNEDGGTATSQLMARWGRTTDIEWIYRVEVDAQGRRVPGSGVFQGAAHVTNHFHGPYDGTHPILQTCTTNNNVCDARALKRSQPRQQRDPMRFALSTRDVLAEGQPRESLMDRHPWTYQVMAQEMIRERKVEAPGASDPSTPAMSDQRNYLYLALTHTTDPSSSAAHVGLAVDVRLHDDPTTYSSDHVGAVVAGLDFDILNRDGPAATTVELPAGTTPQDVESIDVRRVPYPLGPVDDAPITVSSVQRAFFLDDDYLPQASFVPAGRRNISLTPDSPTAVLWARTE